MGAVDNQTVSVWLLTVFTEYMDSAMVGIFLDPLFVRMSSSLVQQKKRTEVKIIYEYVNIKIIPQEIMIPFLSYNQRHMYKIHGPYVTSNNAQLKSYWFDMNMKLFVSISVTQWETE